jgi:predicted nucleic acid-binding protein
MILVDTSAWVEFLRDTGSTACRAVDELLAKELAICDVVTMELLAGARGERHLGDLRRLLARAIVVPMVPADYEDAASLYRTCRRGGETVRRMIDCLIASVTIRAGAQLLHHDADFTVLARHTSLRIAAGSSG